MKKQKAQHYATISLGPDKVGADRRKRYYAFANARGFPFSTWVVITLDDAVSKYAKIEDNVI